MAKILHTADWQIGMKAKLVGDKANYVRQIRFKTAEKIVQLSHDENVDLVIIAGDLFENHDIDEKDVKKTVEILNKFSPIPVFILPGNHDPIIARGIWTRTIWNRKGDHITFLSDCNEYPFSSDLVLYPCPLTQKLSSRDPTDWIPQRNDSDKRIRIGVAHGSYGNFFDNSNFPINQERCALSGLDYLALGDWHSTRIFNNSAYSGTMEQTSFSEEDSGNVLIIDIEPNPRKINITKVPTGILSWIDDAIEVYDSSDIIEFEKKIRDLNDLENILLKLTILIIAEVNSTLNHDINAALQNFNEELLFFNYKLDEPQVSSDFLEKIPDGVLKDVYELLEALIEGRIPEGEDRKYANIDANIIKTARSLLYNKIQEGLI